MDSGTTTQTIILCFVMRTVSDRSRENHEVALFRKRGDDDPLSLGPIVEHTAATDASPSAAAWRLIQENTTLTKTTADLRRQGQTGHGNILESFGDFYTFLFYLKVDDFGLNNKSKYETTGWGNAFELLKPETIKDKRSLISQLQLLWFECWLGASPGSAGEYLSRGLDRLRHDYVSGARTLATIALGVLRNIIMMLNRTLTGDATWWLSVRIAAWHIWKNGRESMNTAILNVITEALAKIKTGRRTMTMDEVRSRATEYLDDMISKRAESTSAGPITCALIEHLENRLFDAEPTDNPKTETFPQPNSHTISILTISESSTIMHCLQGLISRSRFTDIELRVLESRPLFEGVSLASTIVRFAQSQAKAEISAGRSPAKKIKVVLFTEASTAFAASNVDVVLLGADRIACSGAVSNKTGSLQTALCAKALSLNGGRHKMQVIVVSETEKIAPPSDSSEHVVENNEAGLVSCDWHSNLHSERLRDAAAVLDQATTDETMTATLNIEVKIENVFFEWVGPDLIDAYITEKGTWTTEDIKQYSKDLGQKKKEVFADI